MENNRVRFERTYRYNEGRPITFRTVLTVKVTGSVVENEVFLYPLGKGEEEAMLRKAGFTEIRFYGDFLRAPLVPEILPLVMETSG